MSVPRRLGSKSVGEVVIVNYYQSLSKLDVA